MTILRVALFQSTRLVFDYLPPDGWQENTSPLYCRVRIPMRKKEIIGIVIATQQKSSVPEHKLKKVIEFIDEYAQIQPDILELCQFVSQYYLHPLGDVFANALPNGFKKGKPLQKPMPAHEEIPAPVSQYHLTQEQQQVLNAIENHQDFQVFLIYGVTGSGKTLIYLEQIKKVLAQGKQILFLVPEIALTPQTMRYLQSQLTAPVMMVHSGLTPKQKIQNWYQAHSKEACVLLGTRSSIFSPLPNLGLIIVDEEHDPSYKQQDGLRYHARDLSIWRAKQKSIPILLGSASPSTESWLNAKQQRYIQLDLTKRATGAPLPSLHIIDMQSQGKKILSKELIHAMQETLNKKKQVLLFLNRRGFSPVLYCQSCAWIASCQHCHARLVFHQTGFLQCHRCDIQIALPTHCPNAHTTLLPMGFGTQRIEVILQDLFPDIPIIRLDRDSTKKKGQLQDKLEEIHTTKTAIILGTQIVVKGHHFPNVTLVGILDIDSGFLSADFRAPEYEAQRLWQVAGRAGREESGQVYIQTRLPNLPLLNCLHTQGYSAFMDCILQERLDAKLPPFNYSALLYAKCKDLESLNHFFNKIKKWLELKINSPQMTFCFMLEKTKIKNLYHGKILFFSNFRKYRNTLLNQLALFIAQENIHPNIQWIFDVDPINW